MKIFITGTDTDVGKTLISSWLCLHTNYNYWKPIQTGSIEGIDSDVIRKLTKSKIHPENYIYPDPVSPHMASSRVSEVINMDMIKMPICDNLIIEGAGGVLVPLNRSQFIIDLIEFLATPVIVVARSTLGTINHTLLTLELLKSRNIKVLGVIINGFDRIDNASSIEFYGKTQILASFPKLAQATPTELTKISFSDRLNKIFGI